MCILVCFSGACAAFHALPLLLSDAGAHVVAYDTRLGGADHDVTDGVVGPALIARIAANEFDAVFLAPPCSTFSIRRRTRLRSVARPWGVKPVPKGFEHTLRTSNRLVEFSMAAISAARAAGVPLAIENPAARSDDQSYAYWEDYSDWASIWDIKEFAQELQASSAKMFTFAQCAPLIGGEHQKWTTIAATGSLRLTLAPLLGCLCPHGAEHSHQTIGGVDSAGQSVADLSAAYPEGLNRLLCDALVVGAGLARAAADAPVHTAEPAGEGRITDGIFLGVGARASCERARSIAPSFGSLRNTARSPQPHLRREPFAFGFGRPNPDQRPPRRSGALRRRRWPGKQAADPSGSAADADALLAAAGSARPPGPIHIRDLFLADGYAVHVETWLILADVAAQALRKGTPFEQVPTRVLGQEYLQPWARGVVWDCRDHEDCRPVQRSTRTSGSRAHFAGRQIDREALRRVAELISWPDMDICDQISEGGVEARADCELAIVLTFHHPSLTAEVAVAAKAVEANLKEEWVTPPTRHLPFVPCRLQPRGLVFQSRTRVLPDGSVEEYDKPRVTSDGSFGGIDSSNAALQDDDRGVALPSAQTLGRGWAVCASAFPRAPRAPSDAGVGGYCVDAESAYSFCCVQEADLWLQCFCWWDEVGSSGFVVDYRMGFGGAFAPNRFERLSALVSAYIQFLQDEFDDANPYPLCAQRWISDREAMQSRGELPPGRLQTSPRYLQPFIDDFCGATSTDKVSPPPSVASIRIDPKFVEALGHTPFAADTRVHVHAQLAVLGLRTVGLVAAPHKIACCEPLPALGLLFRGTDQRICCPPGKLSAVEFSCQSELQALADSCEVRLARAERLLGRLCSLAQVAPDLRAELTGGYRACSSIRRAPSMSVRRLAPGSPAFIAWRGLLTAAPRLIAARDGVEMAPRLIAPGRFVAGSLTSVTDASGDDGVGGYAFLAGTPRHVFILSEPWPPSVLHALAAAASPEEAALRRAGDPDASVAFPVPAAELAGSLLLPRLVKRSACVRRSFAVCDCQPAVGVLTNLHSGTPIMSSLIPDAQLDPDGWFAAHVPREQNQDADILSHPARWREVESAALAAGFSCTRVRPTQQDWDDLQHCIFSAAAQQQRSKKKKKRKRDVLTKQELARADGRGEGLARDMDELSE